MALYRCNSSSPIEPVETTLWTNNSPTSAMNGNTTVNLSDDITNYDFLRFYHKNRSTGSDETRSILIPVDVFKQYGNNADYCISAPGSGVSYARAIHYASDTTVKFNHTYKMGQSGTDNAYCIPLSIAGYKI